MKKEALLLIDIQNIYFTPGPLLLHKPKEAAGKAARLLEKFRKEGKTVIHVQHDFKILACINKLVEPLEDEKIVHKEFESREDAKAWICANQLGRRNITPEYRKYLIGMQYDLEKCVQRKRL